jgi:hypothetical protein
MLGPHFDLGNDRVVAQSRLREPDHVIDCHHLGLGAYRRWRINRYLAWGTLAWGTLAWGTCTRQ